MQRASHNRADFPTMGRRKRTELTTVRLLDAAAVEFIELGYDGARISSIARRAGLTPGAVYARWQNKNELMAATLDHIFERILPGAINGDSNDRRVPDIEALLGLAARAMRPDDRPRVMVQVFASTRNNAEMGVRLRAFLNREAEQLERLIEEGKESGSCDPAISTAAMTFLFQSLGIGVELMFESGIDDRHAPTAEQWEDLMRRFMAAVAAPESAPD